MRGCGQCIKFMKSNADVVFMKRIAFSASDLFMTPHKKRLLTSPITILMSVLFIGLLVTFVSLTSKRLTLKKIH
jgi:hypothetical protein